MTIKANAQKEAIKWLTECGGEATFVDQDRAVCAPNNSFYYANRSFWKALGDRVEFSSDGQTIKVIDNAA